MFKRRIARTKLQSLREIFWPEMGWIRASYYAKHRLVRLSSSTHHIATGLACGACVSFTPFFGCHFIIALGYAWLLRGHFLASVIGTFVGNPWTFPFLFWMSFETGTKVLEFLGFDLFSSTDASSNLQDNSDSFYEFLTHNCWDFYIPTALGGVICMILFWPLFYALFFLVVRSAKLARKRHLRRKWKKKWRKAVGKADHIPVDKDDIGDEKDIIYTDITAGGENNIPEPTPLSMPPQKDETK